ncbi:hypothetical protein BKA70DRAFT_1229814 [Coprinopsis sp. MPI-PUGE-AT-0042]|nr:hypothetical protein BKA70DRAFT_1229814 [Coprinopsis sp. MPI-PUGE-AT-0042]
MSPNNASPEGTRATSPQSIPELTHMTSHPNLGTTSSSLLSPNSAAMLLSPSATTSPTRDKTSKRRTSQNLRVAGGTGAAGVMERVGSPNSIPSSPTSVHSSSSAIFERDIEPMLSPSSTSLQSPISPTSGSRHAPTDPHRIPRSRNTEQLEQAVPSVLDSAAAILATLDIDAPAPGGDATSGAISVSPPERNAMDQISVVAPATSTFEGMLGGGGRGGRSSGFASPLSFRSRSPSPHGSRVRAQNGTDLLLGIPTTSMVSPHTVSSTVSSPTRSPKSRQATLGTSPSSRHATLGTSPTGRNATLSTSPTFGSTRLSSSPPYHAPAMSHSISKDSTLSALTDTPSLLTPTTEFDPATASSFTTASLTSNPTSPVRSSHPPSPHAATKRLSFMSYSDLLSSTPASTLPLASLTKEARGDEPPPHIPSVSGLNLVSAAAASVGGGSSLYSGGSAGKRGSRTPSVHGFAIAGLPAPHSTSPSPPAGLNASLAPFGASSATNMLNTISHGHSQGGLSHANKRDSIALLDNVGGEWEREGLGMGLEERLDLGAGAGVGVGKIEA